MIGETVVAEICHLLEEGRLSQRSIARRAGVSRGTVNAIALGKRPDPTLRRRPESDFVPPSGSLRRCPSCGGLVQMPCLLCYVRSVSRHGQKRA
jgi:hypothetical protein